MDTVCSELVETGFVEGFEHCHYRAPRGMRVDGYWFNDEGALEIFVADFDCRRQLGDAYAHRRGRCIQACPELLQGKLGRFTRS